MTVCVPSSSTSPQKKDDTCQQDLEQVLSNHGGTINVDVYLASCNSEKPLGDKVGLPGYIDSETDHSDIEPSSKTEVSDTLGTVFDTLRMAAQADSSCWSTLQKDKSTPSTRRSGSSIRSIGSKSSYLNGRPRTLLRGWLHGFLGMLVYPGAMLVLFLCILIQELPPRWILAEILLASNCMSFLASGALHLIEFQELSFETWTHRADLIMISVSIGASPCPFILQLKELMVSMAVHLLFVVLTAIAVFGRRKGARISLTVIQFVLAELQFGLHFGYTAPLWFTSLIFFILGFSCYMASTTKFAMPWHYNGWYGFHEDFHVLLFVAQTLVLVAAVQFLSDPSRDENPNWIS